MGRLLDFHHIMVRAVSKAPATPTTEWGLTNPSPYQTKAERCGCLDGEEVRSQRSKTASTKMQRAAFRRSALSHGSETRPTQLIFASRGAKQCLGSHSVAWMD